MGVESGPCALCRGENSGGKDTDGKYLFLDSCGRSGDLIRQNGEPQMEDDTAKTEGASDADVESKIRSGHANARAEFDCRIGNVKPATTVVVERTSEADANDKDWSECVRIEKAAMVAGEEAEAALVTACDATRADAVEKQENRDAE